MVGKTHHTQFFLFSFELSPSLRTIRAPEVCGKDRQIEVVHVLVAIEIPVAWITIRGTISLAEVCRKDCQVRTVHISVNPSF